MTHLLADAGETAGLAVLVYGVDDPVDPGVSADLKAIKTHPALYRKHILTALWLGSTRITS